MRRRILSGDGHGLQNRCAVARAAAGRVRLPHASANLLNGSATALLFALLVWNFQRSCACGLRQSPRALVCCCAPRILPLRYDSRDKHHIQIGVENHVEIIASVFGSLALLVVSVLTLFRQHLHRIAGRGFCGLCGARLWSRYDSWEGKRCLDCEDALLRAGRYEG